MRLFKLKTSRLAWIFAIVAILLHLGSFYLIATIIKNQNLAVIWHNSLRIYWPALFLVQIFGQLANGSGPLFGIVLMIAAALFQWWLIFCALISLVRIYFRKPPISSAAKVAIVFGTLVVAACFWKMSPENLGDSRSPLERAMDSGDTNAVARILKSNPSLANKPFRFGNETPLFRATETINPKANIGLLVDSGADINAKSGGFNLTPLQQAAWSGNVEAVKALLNHKPDVNAIEGQSPGRSALNYAVNYYENHPAITNLEIVDLLLENGADVNPGYSVLFDTENRSDLMDYLLEKGANPNVQDGNGDTPLHRAILFGRISNVVVILQHHPDLSIRYKNGADNFSPSELAMDEGHLDIALMLQKHTLQIQSNKVFFAAANGDLDSIRALITKNPQSIEDKDEIGFTPLTWAAQAGQKSVVEFLLENGANINSTDQKGNTPLHWSVFTQQSNIVETLINHKADLNLKGAGGKSPLHLAVQQGFIPIVEMLLKAGANPNATASGGETPLCIAVANGNVEAVKLLLAYHSDFSVHCYEDTLFHIWARGSGNLEIADLLLANGCEVNAKGREGQTPLHALIETAMWPPNQQGQIQAVQWLLDHKADVNAKNDKGQTPLSLLKWHNRGRTIEKRKDIGDLLRKYGAKE